MEILKHILTYEDACGDTIFRFGKRSVREYVETTVEINSPLSRIGGDRWMDGLAMPNRWTVTEPAWLGWKRVSEPADPKAAIFQVEMEGGSAPVAWSAEGWSVIEQDGDKWNAWVIPRDALPRLARATPLTEAAEEAMKCPKECSDHDPLGEPRITLFPPDAMPGHHYDHRVWFKDNSWCKVIRDGNDNYAPVPTRPSMADRMYMYYPIAEDRVDRLHVMCTTSLDFLNARCDYNPLRFQGVQQEARKARGEAEPPKAECEATADLVKKYVDPKGPRYVTVKPAPADKDCFRVRIRFADGELDGIHTTKCLYGLVGRSEGGGYVWRTLKKDAVGSYQVLADEPPKAESEEERIIRKYVDPKGQTTVTHDACEGQEDYYYHARIWFTGGESCTGVYFADNHLYVLVHRDEALKRYTWQTLKEGAVLRYAGIRRPDLPKGGANAGLRDAFRMLLQYILNPAARLKDLRQEARTDAVVRYAEACAAVRGIADQLVPDDMGAEAMLELMPLLPCLLRISDDGEGFIVERPATRNAEAGRFVSDLAHIAEKAASLPE